MTLRLFALPHHRESGSRNESFTRRSVTSVTTFPKRFRLRRFRRVRLYFSKNPIFLAKMSGNIEATRRASLAQKPSENQSSLIFASNSQYFLVTLRPVILPRHSGHQGFNENPARRPVTSVTTFSRGLGRAAGPGPAILI